MCFPRPFALAALLAGVVITLPAPAAAQATQTRSWRVCFSSAIGSCSEFFLSTTAAISLSGDRIGTLVDVTARHQTFGQRATGLQTFTFYGGATGGSSDETPTALTPAPINGAPVLGPDQANRWSARGSTNEADRSFVFDNWLSFTSGFDPEDRQFIGGCAGAVFDDENETAATTCGDEAYGFSFTSSVWIDAVDIERLGVDVYAGDANGDFVPDLASCSAPIDGTAGVGIDLGEPDFTATCVAEPLAVHVPEPPTRWLLSAAGLALIGLVVRRRASHRWLRSAAATMALTACAGSDHPAAPPTGAVTPVVVSAELQAAVTDASERVVPALDAARQPALMDALADLQQALQMGERRRVDRALDRLDGLVQPDETAAVDAADLAVLRVLVDVARESLATAR
ncbi:hypothetical protein [Gemmatimonas sp.]|uniref:hypothetical protein n=1 Tax=Gemmatimonas sp. TaxID=1962908 RepID=UPI00333FF4D1